MDAAEIVAEIGKSSIAQIKALNQAKEDLSSQMTSIKDELKKELSSVDKRVIRNETDIEKLKETVIAVSATKKQLMQARVKLYGQIGLLIASIAAFITAILK